MLADRIRKLAARNEWRSIAKALAYIFFKRISFVTNDSGKKQYILFMDFSTLLSNKLFYCTRTCVIF